jgi:hypothetical protein
VGILFEEVDSMLLGAVLVKTIMKKTGNIAVEC